MGTIIGIDLGTTNSVVAVMDGSRPVVIPNAEGNNLTPSLVSFTGNRSYIVGENARSRAAQYPEDTIFSVKRLMGRKFRDPAVQQDLRFLPYKVVEHRQGDAWVEVRGNRFSPAEISAMILQKLKLDAEEYLRQAITQAVITVPAHFNSNQVQATRDAARIAGLEALRIVNEPTAACLAYGLNKREDERVMVFSFGGGSLDVSILEFGPTRDLDVVVFEVKSTTGDTHLGGDDLDKCIVDWLIASFHAENGIDLARNPAALQRLKEAAERAKIELSSVISTEINLPYIVSDAQTWKHIHATLTRDKLGELVAPVLTRVEAPIKQAASDADLRMDQIDDVVLVGGQTRMPAIRAQIKSLFGKEPLHSINPDEVVALGAGVQAGVLGGQLQRLLLDVIPFSLSVETVVRSNPPKATNKSDDKDVEHYALPVSDGENPNGVCVKLIERNTTIPTQKSQVFSTGEDGQTRVRIHVLQGEGDTVHENISLGQFVLDGIPPSPKGVPQIEVTFDIDANALVGVKARDRGAGRESHITVHPATTFQRDEIERLAQDAAKFAGVERQRRREAVLLSSATDEADAAEKLLREIGPRATLQCRERIERAISQIRGAVVAADLSAVSGWREVLQTATYALAGELYRPAFAGRSRRAGQAIDPRTLHIFVSHSHVDNLYCRTFVELVRKAGADAWYDEDDLQFGELSPRIEVELMSRSIFIPILTPSSLRSVWVEREARRFEQLYRQDASQTRLILPIIGEPISGGTAIWSFLREFKRIEGPQLQPVSPEKAAELALQALT